MRQFNDEELAALEHVLVEEELVLVREIVDGGGALQEEAGA